MKIDRTKEKGGTDELNIEDITDNSVETPVSTSEMTLTDFLIKRGNETGTETIKVNIGGEFKDFDFIVRPVDLDDIYRKRNETTKFNRKREVKSTNDEEFQVKLIIEGCVEPNFRNVNFIKSIGALTPEQAVRKTLKKAGYITGLSTLIMGASQLMNLDEIEEQAKNL